MSARATVFLAVAVVLAALLYFMTAQEEVQHIPDGTLLGEPRYIDPEAPVLHVLDFDPAEVTAVVLRRDGREVEVRRQGQKWNVADSGAIADILDSLKNLVVLTTIESAAADLVSYGLEEPERQVVLRRPGGAVVLSLGDRNPASTAVYARVDDEHVVLAGALILWEFDKAFGSLTATP